MGKAGRICAIATPMVLTVASLLCLLVVFLGGLNKGDPNLRSLYYFKADTTEFQKNYTSAIKDIPFTNADDKLRNLITKLQSSAKSSDLADVYTVYLWNYCSGSKDNSTSGGVKLTQCSSRKAQFWFNPVEVWGLNGTGVTDLLPKSIENGLNVYHKVSTWMFIAYTVAFWATVVNVVVGLVAIFSRWGSCVTAVVSAVATLFTFLAALTSTILFSTLVGTFNTALKSYGIRLTVGTKMMSLDWIAFAFSLGASLFWTISICCCSGKSSHKTKSAEKHGSAYSGFGGQKYERLSGNHGNAGGHEMDNFGGHGAGSSPYKGRETAYEPFRHERG
ncbi:integral membrane protein [Tothia fuscella]|uniref:Integral membrane protein n=1 Tax=Tothia fuscella TaxID=1048955 RepID=A0A9P4P406_9PEZI|nr:integral membrane protein [Tothia fuscella]